MNAELKIELLELMKRVCDSYQVLGQVMVRMGLMQAQALDDPMNYDHGKTEGIVVDLQAMIRDYWLKRAEADTVRLDWLERNLMTLSHDRCTHSVHMGGECVHGQLVNEARGSGGGPSTFRVCHRSIRDAVDAAMGSGQT